MSKKEIHVIIPLVEGDTEVEFYCEVRRLLLQRYPDTDRCEFLKPVNIKGIGNYKTNAARQFDNAIKNYMRSKTTQKNHKQKKSEEKKDDTKYIFHAFMCIDTDVLDSSFKPARFIKNPPINEDETKKSIKEKCGIPHFIKAVHSIEDWFLEDKDGIVKYLKLPKTPKIDNNKSGAENLKSIFKNGGKLYTKGTKSEGFISCLNVSYILQNHIAEFQELIDLIRRGHSYQ